MTRHEPWEGPTNSDSIVDKNEYIARRPRQCTKSPLRTKRPPSAAQCSTSIVLYDYEDNTRSSSRLRGAQCIASRNDDDYARSSTFQYIKSPSTTVSTSLLDSSDHRTRVESAKRLSKSMNSLTINGVESTKRFSKSNSLPINGNHNYCTRLESTKRLSQSKSLPIKNETLASSSFPHRGSRSPSVVRFECDYPKTQSSGSRSFEQSSYDNPTSILKSPGSNSNSKSHEDIKYSKDDELTATTNSTAQSSTSNRFRGRLKYEIYNSIAKTIAAEALRKTQCTEDDESTAPTTKVARHIPTRHIQILILPTRHFQDTNTT